MEPQNIPVLILGGGISGLATAWFLHKRGIPFRLLEKEPATGGKIKSETGAGSVFDFGPNTIRDKSGKILELAGELGLQDEIVEISEVSKTRYLARNGKLHKIGPGIRSTVSAKILSNSAKLRILKEPFIPAGPIQEESVGDFFERRIGKEAVDYLIDPIFSGIYAGDVYNLSKSVIIPQLAEMEYKHGSITKGGLKEKAKKKEPKGRGKSSVITFKKGLQQFTDALSEKLKDFIVQDEALRIESNVEGLKIITKNNEYTSDRVISCLPAYVLAKIAGEEFPAMSKVLHKVEYAPVLTTQVFYNRADISFAQSGFGFLVPHAEKLNLLGAIWKSQIFPQLTDDDKIHFTLMAGGALNPKIADEPIEETEQKALKDFSTLMKIVAEPVLTKSYLWKHAIPQFNVGFNIVRQQIQQKSEQIPGFYVGSNFMWGASLSECLEGAEELSRSFL